MNTPIKKRHQSFQPLSRDHGVGLLCAQHGQKAVRASLHDRLRLAIQIRALSQNAVLSYLQDEQKVLSALIDDHVLRAEFQQHHNSIRKLIYQLDLVEPSVDPGIGLLAGIAAALESYVRWEENALFPHLEQTLGYENLRKLSGMTESMELERKRPTQLLHQSVRLELASGLPPQRANKALARGDKPS